MKVLLQRPAPDHFGGGILATMKMQEYLTALGVKNDLTYDLEPDLRGYDLVHLFNQPKMDQVLIQCANAQRQAKPLLFSSIYCDEKILLQCLLDDAPIADADIINRLFLFNHLYGTVLGEADLVLTASNIEKTWLARDFGLMPEKMVAAPLAAESFFADASPEKFINSFGFKDFIICVGVLHGTKNQLRLIRALRDFPAPLLLVYSNSFFGYEQLCREAAGDNVKFIGQLDQPMLASAYAAAKVHALISCYEPTGLANIEAGLAGCNLVCTANSPIYEYVGEHAFYAEPMDVPGIRAAIEKAYAAPKSHVLRDALLQDFTWDRTAKTILAAYETLLAGKDHILQHKGEARYRWLMAYHDNVKELRTRSVEAAKTGPVYSLTVHERDKQVGSLQQAVQERDTTIASLEQSLQERERQFQAVTKSLGYRLHHRLAWSLPARAIRSLRNAGPTPVFTAPRGPALNELANYSAEIKKVLLVAKSRVWHIHRALGDIEMVLPKCEVILAATAKVIEQLKPQNYSLKMQLLKDIPFSNIQAQVEAVIVVGEVTPSEVELSQRTGAKLLIQYNTTGHLAGAAYIDSPAKWRKKLVNLALRRPVITLGTWLISHAYTAKRQASELFFRGESLEISCVFCGKTGPAQILIIHAEGLHYVRCPQCKLIQLANPPSEQALIDPYEDPKALKGYFESRTDPVTRFRHERILSAIEKWSNPGLVVDVGCSDGRFLEVARDAGWQVEGVETSKSFVEEAERFLGKIFYNTTLQAANLASDHYDAVNMSHVIEHVRDPKGLVLEARRILKAGGILAISTPNIRSLPALVQRGKWHQICPYHHVPLFSQATLEKLLRASGYKILISQTIAVGRVLGEVWTPQMFRWLPGKIRGKITRHEIQLDEYLAKAGMGEELLVIARK